MIRVSSAIALVPLLVACQSGTPRTSKGQLAATVPTVPEVARSTTMTIFANENHANKDQCFHTILNRYVMNHAGVCANHYGHGGRWRMDWRAQCERQVTAACEESYPVLTGKTRTEVKTWKGVNEHSHNPLDWASCGRWTWDSSWEGANYGDCQSKGDVILNSGTGQEHATAAVGVGYSAKHAEDQIVVSPGIFITAEGPGAGAGLEFSYRDQSWGNGYEVQCEYKCDWAAASQEVVLMEKCWNVGLEDSDESSTMQTSATGLTYDDTWHELRRSACTEDEGDAGSDDGGDDGSDDGSTDQDAGSGDGGGADDGVLDAGAGDDRDGGFEDPDPQDAGGTDRDGGAVPGDGGVSNDAGGVDPVPDDAGITPHDGGPGPIPHDAGPTPRDAGVGPA